MAIKRTTVTKHSVILNPEVTHKAEIEFTVINGIPNGDPDSDGGSRIVSINDQDHALVTDVATKRKVRDYVDEVNNRLLYVKRSLQDRRNELVKAGIFSEEDSEKRRCVLLKDWARYKNVTDAKGAVKTFWDVRMFGAVIGEKGAKEQILGPVQVGFAFSHDPVDEQNLSITRLASETENTTRTIGRKYYIPKACFTQKIRYSGHLGKRHLVSEEDLADLWESLINGFEFRPSTMRGEQFATRLTVWTYPNAIGALDEGEKPLITVIENCL